MPKLKTEKKSWATPGHVGPGSDPRYTDNIEGPGLHNGIKVPAPTKVRDAKSDGGAAQRRSVNDRRRATGETK